MRFYQQRHQYTCGIDLHARSMHLCILDRDGQIVFDRNLPCTPAAMLGAIEPFRDDLVISAECMFAWYWLADVCLEQKITFVLGHALYMKAIHGGKAKNDQIDAHKIARLTYGQTLPIAYVYPPAMRATRDLMRRRCHFVHQRARLLAHIQMTCHQYNLPSFNKRIAYRSNRPGVLDHFATLDPSVSDMIQADLNIIDHLEDQIRHLELMITRRAKQHDTNNYHRLRSVVGVGKVLALTLLYEIHEIERFSKVQDFLSYARLEDLPDCMSETITRTRQSPGEKEEVFFFSPGRVGDEPARFDQAMRLERTSFLGVKQIASQMEGGNANCQTLYMCLVQVFL